MNSTISAKFLFFFLTTFLLTSTIKATPTFLYQVCSSNKTNTNSTYETKLKTLFSSLSSNATNNNEFYNTTIPSKNPSNTACGKQGGRVLFPCCNIIYELYPFYTNIAPSPSPSTSPASLAPPGIVPSTNTSNSNLGGGSGISSGTIVAIVVPITVVTLLFIVGICFLCIRGREEEEA